MAHHATTRDGKCNASKRMLAAGRKINGVWEVRTFLRGAPSTRAPFWESTVARARSRRAH